MASLQLKHLYKVYPNGVKAVNDFNMTINDREFIVFVGPSGCGKSTTLRMIAGLEEITAGELFIDDKLVNYEEPKNRDIAMVFQNYALYPHLNVYENIAFGLRLRRLPKAEIDEKVNNAARMLGLTNYLKTKPGALSGGQRQRVALGRALVREPKVFLLDEPLSNLDAKLRVSMRKEITKLHNKLQTTFIYVTHDQVEAMTMGDRIVVMKDGFVQQIDTPKNLYRYPVNKFVAGFIGTPQLNFTDATLLKDGNKVKLSVVGTDISFDLPQESLINVDPTYFDGKKIVSFGLRTEFVSLKNKFPYSCQMKVVGVEELGTKIQLFTDFDVNRDVLDLSSDDEENAKSSLTITTDSDSNVKLGDIVKVYLDLDKLHLFDENTEEVINPRVPPHGRVKVSVKDKSINLMGVNFAMEIADGDYDVVVPINALKRDENGLKLKVYKVEEVNGQYLLTFYHNGNALFMLCDEQIEEGTEVKVSFETHLLDFYQGEEKVVASLNVLNELDGMVYYHREKNEEGKTVKVLDYIFNEDVTLPCFNKSAYQSFILNKDRSVYDLDLVFKFYDNQIHLDENGAFTGEPVRLLNYGINKFLVLKCFERELIVKLSNEEIDLNNPIHFSIDVDDIQVFDKIKNIRLV